MPQSFVRSLTLWFIAFVLACASAPDETEEIGQQGQALEECRDVPLSSSGPSVEVILQPSMTFAIPSSVEVVPTKKHMSVTLRIQLPDTTWVRCRYTGNVTQAGSLPVSGCSRGFSDGDLITSIRVRLKSQGGSASTTLFEEEPCQGTGTGGFGGAGFGGSADGGATASTSSSSSSNSSSSSSSSAVTTSASTTSAGGGGFGGEGGHGGAPGGGGQGGEGGMGGQGGGGAPPCVADGDPCTIDLCDPDTGEVTHARCTPVTPGQSFKSTLAFLWEGAVPVQTGLGPNALGDVTTSALRGRALLDDGTTPAVGGQVRILGHDELGTGVVAADGTFIMAVNGGGPVAVVIEAQGYLPVQRSVDVPWGAYGVVDDVILIQASQQATTVDLDTMVEMAVVTGDLVSDTEGERQPTLMVPPGASAAFVMPDGSTQPASTLTLRMTEYTTTSSSDPRDAERRMPAPLPPASAFTLALEVGADEAEALGAAVVFDTPVGLYIEADSFLPQVPIGMRAPTAYFDRTRGVWVPTVDGRLVQILAAPPGGAAEVDASGDGVADDDATLEALGITFEARVELAELHPAGTRLFFTEVEHLSPIDVNFLLRVPPYVCAALSCDPADPDPEPDVPDDDRACEVSSSILECTNNVLRESAEVTGTPYSLHYSSHRVPGFTAQQHVRIPFSGPSLPNELLGIRVSLEVGGRTFEQSFACPCPLNGVIDFAFDGLDAFGRKLEGSIPARARVGYEYQLWYAREPDDFPPRSFGAWGEATDVVVDGRSNRVFFNRDMPVLLESRDARAEALGGFTLSDVHRYDVAGATLLRGDGTRLIDPIHRGFRRVTPGTTQVFGLTADSLGSVYYSTFNSFFRRTREGTTTLIAGGSQACTPGGGVPAVGACLGRQLRQPVFGPDGSIYALSGTSIVRIDPRPDGLLTIIAGNPTQSGGSGDGGRATDALLSPSALAVSRDGSIYVAQNRVDPMGVRIRRIDTGGFIATVAGGPIGFSAGNGGPASEATFTRIYDMEFGPDDSLYVLDEIVGGLLRRIRSDGLIEGVAGYGNDGISEGGEALTQFLDRPTAIAVSKTGTIWINPVISPGLPGCTGEDVPLVREITLDGQIRTIAGKAQSCCSDAFGGGCGEGGPALPAWLGSANALTSSPDDGVYAFNGAFVYRLRSDMPKQVDHGFVVVEEDGRTAYLFDVSGRHLETVDARLGITQRLMGYDPNGLLTSITDEDGLITTIERDALGTPTVVRGPFGHETTLGLDPNGWLTDIGTPAGPSWHATFDESGLMQTWSNRNGHTGIFDWAPDGRLLEDQNAASGALTLTRVDSPNRTVDTTFTTSLGRETAYHSSRGPDLIERRSTLFPSGLSSVQARDGAGTTITEVPDGTLVTTTVEPDPRWGMQSLLPATTTEELPSGLTRTITQERTVMLADPGDPFSLVTETNTTTVAGRTWTTTYDATTRTETTTTPEGRVSSVRYDAQGHVVEMTTPDTLPITMTYDVQGRLRTTTQGPRATIRDYGTDGLLAMVTDPLTQTTSFTRDDNGRVTQETRPDLEFTLFEYDGEDNTTGVTPADKPEHGMTYNNIELLGSYDPPALPTGPTPTTYSYDLDRMLETVVQPGPRQIDYGYDFAGRLETVTFPTGQLVRSYDPFTGQLSSIAGPNGVTVSYAHDGRLMTSMAWNGLVTGTVSWVHDSSFRVIEERVNGAFPVAFTYDDDDLLTQVGDLQINRDPESGRVVSTHVGVVDESYTSNEFGEPDTYVATANGNVLLGFTYERDDLGRITRKTENNQGVTTVFEYEYDPVGRLTRVLTGSVETERYEYDGNGNRTFSKNSAGEFSATFDDQDRILTYGDLVFSFNENGDLLSRTDVVTADTWDFSYDALGNLKAVTLPDGTDVEYLVDGQNRRVSKLVDGAIERTWVWRSSLQIVAELDAVGLVTKRFEYAGDVAPERMVTSSGVYRLVKDRLGSVTKVVEISTGVVVQELAYDTWGRVLLDTNPDFQPFGYAGGLYDADTGLVRFGARDYDAELGRWTAKDPARFAGGKNFFAYVGCNPINWRDPWGLCDPEGGSGCDPGTDPFAGDGQDGAGYDGETPLDDPDEAEPAEEPDGYYDDENMVCVMFPGSCAFASMFGCGRASYKSRKKTKIYDECHTKMVDCFENGNIPSYRCSRCWEKCRAYGGWPLWDSNNQSCDYKAWPPR